ncbi:DNA cytosine methyltransferase [Clostridium pasteurianum]|uniref:Cytosine-specific methyltransferase n=1 Tax=Clostridium pasteurianum BC1 TaxID=86416 RepID=R4KBW9_CLOPA|nr:DNA cytosine methyltransferase [Clostridium pasteurianum]AGK97120.1 DNA-methyltransferase Dcm [Clostridium pasteurianum BC1]
MNFIDLFAGAGGLSDGFVSAGFTPIAHIEMNEYASLTLKTRTCYYYLKEHRRLNVYYRYLRGEIFQEELYNSVPNNLLSTIMNEEISDKSSEKIFNNIDNILQYRGINKVDVIIGGPPCQAYSLVGRSRDENNMEDDPRNYLYKQYIKFLNKYKPDMFVFENVPGILTAKGGKTFKNIIAFMKRVGYEVYAKPLNASDFGVLQNRKRIIIIGWRKGSGLKYPEFESINVNAVVDDILRDLIPLNPGEENNEYIKPINKYLKWSGIRKKNDVLTHHMCRTHNERDREIYRLAISAWNDGHRRLKYTDLPEKLCTHKNKESFLDRFKVLASDIPCSHTMIAHISKDGHHFIHPYIEQCRSISVREAARIQSFPDNYFFEGPRTAKFVQIGNAVPPLMAKGIAEKIKEMLD